MGTHRIAIGPRLRRQLRLPGKEARHHRGVHDVRDRQRCTEQIGSAGAEALPRLPPQRLDPRDVGQRPRRAAVPGEVAPEVHPHRLAQLTEASVHLRGDRARVGTGDAILRPQRRCDLGAIVADRERFPDTRAAMLEIRHQSVGRQRDDRRRRAGTNEADHHVFHIQSGEAHREPAAHRPGRVTAVAGVEFAVRHGLTPSGLWRRCREHAVKLQDLPSGNDHLRGGLEL